MQSSDDSLNRPIPYICTHALGFEPRICRTCTGVACHMHRSCVPRVRMRTVSPNSSASYYGKGYEVVSVTLLVRRISEFFCIVLWKRIRSSRCNVTRAHLWPGVSFPIVMEITRSERDRYYQIKFFHRYKFDSRVTLWLASHYDPINSTTVMYTLMHDKHFPITLNYHHTHAPNVSQAWG